MDDIWRNAAKKTRERAQRTTALSPATSTKTTAANTANLVTNSVATTNSTATTDFPRPPEELKLLWQKTAKKAVKKAYQDNLVRNGYPPTTNRAVTDRATRDAIAANTSIKQHDAKLHEMKRAWCREKNTPFPDYIDTTFATVRTRLEARDAKHAQRVTQLTNNQQPEHREVRGTEQEEGIGEKKDRKEQESKKEGKQTTKVSSGNTSTEPSDTDDAPSRRSLSEHAPEPTTNARPPTPYGHAHGPQRP